jgi:hypothetical protein
VPLNVAAEKQGLDPSEIRLSFCPKSPLKPEDLDIPVSIVEDLMLRCLYTKGTCSLRELSRVVKLPFPLLHTVFQQLRGQQLFEISGMNGNDYIFSLSGVGREHAAKRFLTCHYIGPAPVSVASYNHAVRSQAAQPVIDRDVLKVALADLVVTDRFIDELGPALVSQKSIFLYGPTGNGKTSVVSRLARIHRDAIVIPYAVEVDGQVIIVFDPAVHERIGDGVRGLDPRWVACRRPCIIVGGELEPNMLELQLEEAAKVYAAPIQMRANNGMLVIDDFGRQVMTPMYLLNRWIVPLDRRVDYLTLRYGLKFEVPFETCVIFATNLDPSDLADEAFLRRIPNKIFVDAVGEEAFDQIFERVLKEKNLVCRPDAGLFFRKLCREAGVGELRACYPADVIGILLSISAFEGKPAEATPAGLARAANIYFARTKEV